MMSLNKAHSETNQKNYKKRYMSQFDAEAEWLKRSAIQRVNSIQYFLNTHSINPRKILDLGCGTGAILEELQSRGIGEKYVGVDYSENAIEYIRNHNPNIDAHVADLTTTNHSFTEEFDLVIMIHVLQHLEDPDLCLNKVLSQIKFKYLIIEVPFEDLLLNRMVTSLHLRKKNPSGSMHFFNMKSFSELLVRNNLSIIDQRQYSPVFDLETLKVLEARYGWSRMQFYKSLITAHYLPKFFGPLKMRLYYAYSSVLCQMKEIEQNHE